MFDPAMRRLIGPPLERAGTWLATLRLSANAVTLAGLAVGLLVLPCLAAFSSTRLPWSSSSSTVCAMALMARSRGGPVPPRSGGYLDMSAMPCSTLQFRSASPWPTPLPGPWAALLLAAFVCTPDLVPGRGDRGGQAGEADDGVRGRKSFFYAAGIVVHAVTKIDEEIAASLSQRSERRRHGSAFSSPGSCRTRARPGRPTSSMCCSP